MKISVGSILPTLVVFAGLGWSLHLYLEPPAGATIPKMTSSEVAESLLSPRLDPSPDRDPFRLPGDLDQPPERGTLRVASQTPSPAVSRSRTPAGADASQVKIASVTTSVEGLGARIRRLAERLEAEANRLKSRAEQARLIQADLKAKIDGKTRLSATSVGGTRRLAILNDHAYVEGEAIDWATGLAGPIVLAEVRRSSVLLRTKGAQVEVSFPRPSKATAAPPSAVVAAPAAKRSSSPRRPSNTATNRPR